MTDESARLGLPYILAGQAQKHITHNEAIRLLDGLVQMAVLRRDLAEPPATPANGELHIVAAGATGDWLGWDFNIAYFVDGAWLKLVPLAGWRAWVVEESDLVIHNGAQWLPLAEALGLITPGASTVVSRGEAHSENRIVTAEELIALAGPFVDSTIAIPDRAVVFGVSTRTVSSIIGPTSYDCGIAGEPGKFGGSLGIAADSTNAGVIGPTAFYADTPVRLTANGGEFAGGEVRIAIHYFLPQPPQL
jgi:hypothetical protein